MHCPWQFGVEPEGQATNEPLQSVIVLQSMVFGQQPPSNPIVGIASQKMVSVGQQAGVPVLLQWGVVSTTQANSELPHGVIEVQSMSLGQQPPS